MNIFSQCFPVFSLCFQECLSVVSPAGFLLEDDASGYRLNILHAIHYTGCTVQTIQNTYCTQYILHLIHNIYHTQNITHTAPSKLNILHTLNNTYCTQYNKHTADALPFVFVRWINLEPEKIPAGCQNSMTFGSYCFQLHLTEYELKISQI